ncbi:MAG: hypothetical protein K2Q01_02595, partial [Rickettsiales bacterium]|nr:hypothetical protein [Rickettsiales bacterium]
YVLDGMIEKVRATMKDVSVQILALEDEFRRNERALAIEEAKRAEIQRKAQEEADVKAREDAEAKKRVEADQWAEAQRKNAPQKTSTLHLLSPKYTNAN